MPAISRQATVTYSCERMYALVSDVSAYKNFLPWCIDSAAEGETDDGRVRASLHLRHKGVSLRLVTLNRHVPLCSIEMELAEGPFKRLVGAWTFTPLADDACRVELEMDFAFSNPVHAGLLKPLFSRVASSLVDAFVTRAREIYG